MTDSVACLTRELVEQYGIEIIPINFYAGGKVYRDWVDITPSEAYELFLKDPESFKTSAATPQDCLRPTATPADEPQIFSVLPSQPKSARCIIVAREAKELAKTELPQVSIEVLDSYTATPAEGFVALAAARAAAEGKDLAEVISAAEKVKAGSTLLFFWIPSAMFTAPGVYPR